MGASRERHGLRQWAGVLLLLIAGARFAGRSAAADETLQVLEDPPFSDVLAAAHKSGKPILVHILTEH